MAEAIRNDINLLVHSAGEETPVYYEHVARNKAGRVGRKKNCGPHQFF
jgi:hypothetical protein